MPLTESQPRAVVALQPVRGNVRAAVRAAIEAIGWRDILPAGSNIALKVNLGWDMFIPGSITSPLVAEALILELREHVGSITLVEADQVLEDVESAFHRSGMGEVCRRTGVAWVNMSNAPMVRIDRPDNTVLRQVDMPQVLQDRLLVTVPVMKTHAKTTLTGALKNQWGCLDKMRHEFHLVLEEALADLNSIVRPALAVMDGTVGLEGNGPKSGQPRVADRILASSDPVALDTIQALSMGIDPANVGHLASCARRGVGVNDLARIEVRGLDPRAEAVPFLPARHNAVSSIENLLRRSTFKRLFFNTPLFRLCLSGAKVYYRIWTARHAQRHWEAIRSHPVYGAQWREGWPGLSSAP